MVKAQSELACGRRATRTAPPEYIVQTGTHSHCRAAAAASSISDEEIRGWREQAVNKLQGKTQTSRAESTRLIIWRYFVEREPAAAGLRNRSANRRCATGERASLRAPCVTKKSDFFLPPLHHLRLLSRTISVSRSLRTPPPRRAEIQRPT